MMLLTRCSRIVRSTRSNVVLNLLFLTPPIELAARQRGNCRLRILRLTLRQGNNFYHRRIGSRYRTAVRVPMTINVHLNCLQFRALLRLPPLNRECTTISTRTCKRYLIMLYRALPCFVVYTYRRRATGGAYPRPFRLINVLNVTRALNCRVIGSRRRFIIRRQLVGLGSVHLTSFVLILTIVISNLALSTCPRILMTIFHSYRFARPITRDLMTRFITLTYKY